MTTTDDDERVGVTPEPTTPTSADGGNESVRTTPASRRTFGSWFLERWSDPPRRRVIIGWAVLAIGLVGYYFKEGIPYSTNSVLLIVMAALVVSSLGSGVRWKRLLADWLPLAAVLFGYGLLRGYASETLWGPFYRPQVWFDTHITGLGVDPTVQLQRWLYRPGLHFYDYLTWACYLTHFFASFIIAGVLWKTNYPKFRRFVAMFVGLTFIGYITYVLYPAMPPWMASEFHHMPDTTRIINQVWKHLHIGFGQSLYAGGDRFDNDVAAMPSLHGAYPMLICLFFWKGSSPRKRILLVAYPILMAFSLIYTGEHFVIDIFVGWIYAAATVCFGSKLLNRWEARRLRKELNADEGSSELDSLEPDTPAHPIGLRHTSG